MPLIHAPKRRAKDDEERILPLINIVFLLLVFFMVAGRLTAPDPFKIELPHSSSDDEAGVQEAMIAIGQDGRLALDGTVMIEAEILSALTERLSSDDGLKVRMKADGQVEAIRVVEVMELLREAGVEKLAMLTVKDTGS